MKASARRKRKHKTIKDSSSAFSSCIYRGDYDSAAKIACHTALSVGGKEGIMNALDNANSFIKRERLRRGII